MKTKIGVEIHKDGDQNKSILKAVANHNEGLFHLTANDIVGYLRVNRALYPNLSSSQYSVQFAENNTIHISENDGKDFTLTLWWKEIHELKEETPDLGIMQTVNEINEQ